MANELTDGNQSWEGGMDMSRHPTFIGDNQYRLGCNVHLPRSGGGISSRHGIHHVSINFIDECHRKIFQTGVFQAEGYFFDGDSEFLVVAISGWVFRLSETFSGSFDAVCVNELDQCHPEVSQGFFTRVPRGCVYNDGTTIPLIVTAGESRRSKPEIGEITSGLFGVYVQNRFFYVTPDRKEIKYSNFQNPYSITESINANLPSFVAPEDQDIITAVGAQKQMLQYAEGGTLIFSTTSNIYSVDIRGAAEDWEESSTRIGKVQESVRGVSAVSANSFASFNTNMYFRTREHGICDLRQSQYQFQQSDDFTSQSIEIDALLENDTSWMLGKATTRTFNGRVYTTVAPEFDGSGNIFWNGMVAYHPDPMYSGMQKLSRRFEGIVTGVRPWGITAINGSRNKVDRLFIWSYDIDGVTRLYQMKKDSFVDVNHLGRTIRVRGFIETRGYNHKRPMELKNPVLRGYSLRDVGTNLLISLLSKTEDQGVFQPSWSGQHLVETYKNNDDFSPVTGQKQQRPYRIIPNEKGSTDGGSKQGRYYYRCDRIEFAGDLTLDSYFKLATLEMPDKSVSRDETVSKFESFTSPKMFTYHIANSPP